MPQNVLVLFPSAILKVHQTKDDLSSMEPVGGMGWVGGMSGEGEVKWGGNFLRGDVSRSPFLRCLPPQNKYSGYVHEILYVVGVK